MSYTSILVHYVFATHERRPLVSDEVQPKLWAYMGESPAPMNQEQHHARKNFADELKMILSLPGIPLTLHAGLLSAAPAALWVS